MTDKFTCSWDDFKKVLENPEHDIIQRKKAITAYKSKPIADAPMDGTPILALCTIRYLPYKKDGQRQMGKKGRWQEATEYGWENMDDEPTEFVEEIKL